MTAVGPDPKVPLSLFTPETQAAALWRFVNPRTPRFASDIALKGVETLGASAVVEELATSIRVRKMLELDALESSQSLPNLIYGDDAQELLGAIEQQGLTLWVGCMPLIAPMPADAPKDIFPYAVGASLSLDINFPGTEQ